MPLVGNQSGTIDLARSWFIEVARNNPRYGGLIQMDVNAWVATSPDPTNEAKRWNDGLDAVMEIIEEDRSHGFDAVAAATFSADGVQNWGLPSLQAWADFGPDGPAEATWAGGKFLYMSRKCLDGLNVLDYAKSSVMRTDLEKPDDKGQPMFCKMNLPKEGEDVSLCRNIRESGFRLCVDPRLVVGPFKGYAMFAARESYTRLRSNAIAALKARAERVAEAPSAD